ncbi:MAG TPA: nuclear transport factor 2 family protein, partial [Candidatus Binatia bacterium]|nr:nuclear transport factor 2 family protein [Candidatus Binatia bacterium]
PADVKFMRTVTVEPVDHQQEISADLAWVSSRSRLVGRDAARRRVVVSTETVVLQRRDGRWLIRHVHWSSAAARDPSTEK